MANCIDFSGRPFHFIGIGGIGMSAIAHILARQKLPVSGSDIRLNHITQRLQDQGAHIFIGQGAENLTFFQTDSDRSMPDLRANGTRCSSESVGDAAVRDVAVMALSQDSQPSHQEWVDPTQLPQVVCSTAIHPDNPEYNAAKAMGCPIFHRSDVLAALMNAYQGIAVAGTHGKTTTSSMIGYMLLQVGLDPSIIVGGEVEAWEGNARLGDSEYLVAEADESDGSLVKFTPSIGVVTNIELDHPDHYHSLDEVVSIFQTFADNCSTVVGCADCENVRQHLHPTVTYSLKENSDATYRADQVVYGGNHTQARIWEGDRVLGTIWLPVLGQHNLSNALAAIAVGRLLGVEFDAIAAALRSFQGARRRFESHGTYHGITLIDDYAHHPSEIQATLAAARLHVDQSTRREGPGRVIAVFQPHRYSRAALFVDEFGQSFSQADVVLVTEVYSAGEVPGRIDGQCMAEAIATYQSQVFYRATLADIVALLRQTLQPGDLVVFLGAGNLNQVIPDLVEFYQKADTSELPILLNQLAS